MRKLIMTMWVTLDGFIAGPNNEMDWLGSFDPAMGQYEDDFVTAADTLLLGRVTYESFAGAWPNVPNNPNADPAEVAYAHKLNAMRKIVFSRTLESVEWNNSSLCREVVPQRSCSSSRSPAAISSSTAAPASSRRSPTLA